MGPLSLILILTLGTSALLWRLPPRRARQTALGAAWAVLVIVTVMVFRLDWQSAGYQFVEQHLWIPSLNVSYHLGVDGISLPLIWVTALLTVLIFHYLGPKVERRELALFLMLEAALVAVFSALDLFLFYVAWELVLIPMYFIIRLWGGPRRDYAAVKFFVYTFSASVIMLLGIMALYFGAGSFDLVELIRTAPQTTRIFQIWVFGALFLGFVVKMPQVPLHTWLPDAHVEAPTEGSALLAGVLIKMGAYGLLRVALPLLPQGAAVFRPLMITIGIVSILYAAYVCLAQRDLKRLVAYSSISHMGVVLLGLGIGTQAALVGAIFTMIAHGLVSPLLFMVSGSLGHHAGTREMDKLGGLATVAHRTGFVLVAGSLASLGLPGMVQFIGEFLVFWGTFQVLGLWTLLPLLTVVITAGYYLWAVLKTLFGPVSPISAQAHDLPNYEYRPMLALLLLIVLFGVWPQLWLGAMNASVAQNILSPLRALGVIP